MAAELEPHELRAVVARARANDADAWAALYRHCHPRLLNYARRRLPTIDAAEDAVSEAMIRALHAIERFTWQGAGFDAWMYGILRNVVLEAQRKPARLARLIRRNSWELDAGRGADDPAASVDDDDDRRTVRAAFETLSPGDREILELRVVGELSAAQAGEVLGKGEGAVRMAQSRALDRLRHAMKGGES